MRVSSAVRHVVAAVTVPFGKPIDQRPHIPTADERLAAYKEKRFAKLKRRELRARAAEGDAEAIAELKSMGLDVGEGAESQVETEQKTPIKVKDRSRRSKPRQDAQAEDALLEGEDAAGGFEEQGSAPDSVIR